MFSPNDLDEFERALVSDVVKDHIEVNQGLISLEDFISIKQLSYMIAAQSMFRLSFKYNRDRRDLKTMIK